MASWTNSIAGVALTVVPSVAMAGHFRMPDQRPPGVLRMTEAESAPASAAALRKVITDLQRGAVDASSMEPALYAALQVQGGAALVDRYGALQGIAFVGTQNGADIYEVTFADGVTLWSIALDPSGRIAGLFFRPVASPEKAGEDVTTGGLSGTLLKPSAVERPPVVLLIAGSGPTDRNGNQNGAGPAELRLLAEGLAARGIASLRYDKRGIGRSVSAAFREQDAVIGSFADDAAAWVAWLQARADLGPVTVTGHSEGGLIALLLAHRLPLAALVLIATPGRRLGDVLREQLQANGLPAPLLAEALATLATLEKGEAVPTVNPALAPLFRPSVQPFLRSVLALDPAHALAGTKLPVMIVSGGHDVQVSEADAARLAGARPDAVRLEIPAMNHVLKTTPADRAAQQDAYGNPGLPLAPELADGIARFVHDHARAATGSR